jgi:osmotically inducible lipoprotein OsmB
MKKIMTFAAIGALAFSLAACETPGERAAGGALIGGATGAAIGGLATGRGSGALAGGLIGAAGGAIIGAGTAPQPRRYSGCPYGVYRDAYGNLYCR